MDEPMNNQNTVQLNEAQQEAVCCIDAPSLVIAGAGSGKTRVLTSKISYLLEQGLKPWNILALTFTNKAAHEMRQRIAAQVGEDLSAGLWMGTFHSVFARILRMEADKIGFTSGFTIYDSADSKSLVKAIVKEMGLDEKKYKPSTVAGRISNAKNALILPSEYRGEWERMKSDDIHGLKHMPDIYARYMEKCRQSNAMDFDDLLLYTWLLFTGHPDVADQYQQRFEFVLVDEYQDTNYAQHRIVTLLTAKRHRICVVGDDAQSIYSFRGANIDNIMKFREAYPEAKLFKLERNYRSTKTIVAAANSLISHNDYQIHKQVYSEEEQGHPVEICSAYSDVDESNIVVRKLRWLTGKCGLSFSDVAVLYRTNAQSRGLEDALRRDAIPYRIYGGLSFYQRKEVKDVVAYFRLAVNSRDEEALRRVINYPARGIGATTLNKLFAEAAHRNVSPWDILEQPDDLDVNKPTKTRLRNFAAMINTFAGYVSDMDARQCAVRVIEESGVKADIFHGDTPEDISRQDNINELLDALSAHIADAEEQGEDATINGFLQTASLQSDNDENDGGDTPEEKVTLMTVHAAKGLEFGAVIVVGLEESLFPNLMMEDSPRHIEEERRLMYVAMTRAKQYLILTHARQRMRYGLTESSNPSRFLKEIDRRFISVDGQGYYTQPRKAEPHKAEPRRAVPQVTHTWQSSAKPLRPISTLRSDTVSATPAAAQGISVGSVIMHDRFGLGVVKRIDGAGVDTKATVEFANAGVKQLLLRFAKFKVVPTENTDD